MSSNQAQLGKLITYQKGYAFKSGLFQDEGVNVVKVGNLGEKSINLKDCVKIPHDKAQMYKDYSLNTDDIIVTSVGSRPPLYSSMVGRAIKVQKQANESLLNQNAIRLRAKDGINQDYVYQSLQTYDYQKHIMRIITGNANQVSISLKDLFKYSFYLPSIDEQKKIAQILSTWDEAIENIGKLIEHEKRAGKVLKNKLLTGKQRFSKFIQTDNFREEIVGLIPNDWKVVKIKEIFKERKERNKDLSQSLQLLSVGVNGVYSQDKSNKRDISSSNKSNYKIVRIDDIAYNTMRLWQGRLGLANMDGLVSPAYTIATPINNTSSRFYSYYFKLPKLISLFARKSQGLVSDTLNCKYKYFSSVPVANPSLEEQNKIANLLDLQEAKIKLLQKKLELLRKQKKGLMQRLLTGKVRIS